MTGEASEGDEWVLMRVPGVGMMSQRTRGADPDEMVSEWVGLMTDELVENAEYVVVQSDHPRGPDRWPG